MHNLPQKILPFLYESLSHLHIFGLALCFLTLWAKPIFARKTNQTVYEHSFDSAAGGASLTKASGEGALFANPALLPYGGKFFRWLGLRTTVIAGKDSVDLARSLLNAPAGSDQGTADGAEGQQEASSFMDRVYSAPIHIGQMNAFSFITSNGGIALFTRIEPDIYAEKTGDLGVPSVHFSSETYAGGIASTAIRSPWRWLSFGLSGKYLLASEPDIEISLTDSDMLQSLSGDGGISQSLVQYNQGIGFDAGALLFFQGQNLDYRLALKIDDLGDTSLSGDADPKEFKQVVSAGTGFTLHTERTALHFALDYRDILNAYEERLFKKVYAGVKLTLFTYLGLAAGFYQGNPSYGFELDMIVLRVAGTLHTRELGEAPGDIRRPIYSISLSTGFDF
jgi:hypothetical protein